MRYAKFFQWWYRSARREVHKRKYYAISRFFWDVAYRRDIMHIAHITTEYKLTAINGRLQLGLIKPSHDINYPGWVDELEAKIAIYNAEGIPLDPIKVMWDWTKHCWVVIDGNHRLAAYKRVFSDMMDVEVTFLLSSNQEAIDAFEKVYPSARGLTHFSVEGTTRSQ